MDWTGMLAAFSDRTSDVMLWSGILVVSVVVLFVVVMAIRRRLDANGGSSNLPPFTLDELRRMRADGRIDDAEYDRAREMIVAYTRGGASPPAPAPPPPSEDSFGEGPSSGGASPDGERGQGPAPDQSDADAGKRT